MYVWNDSWLATYDEEPLEPELPIIDPHHHLWVRDGLPTYLLDELHADTGAGHRVEATVFMECMWGYRDGGPEHLRPVGETETVARLADGSGSTGAEIAGIVGFADLTHPALGEALDAHVDAGRGRFRGIRHATAFDPDQRVRRTHTRPTPGLMGEAAFVDGVRALAARDMSFDAWLYHPQIPELTALARAVPEGRLVLDHLGGLLGIGPYEGHRDAVLARWRTDLTELASCPNVTLKVGGIGMAVYGQRFEERSTPPASDDLLAVWGEPMRFAIEAFGPERCMFESNFPVDKVSCTYVVLWNAFKKVSADLSSTERARLFAGTARDVYRL
ncbi:MAG TPA: amidohydrolase family protein [Acidimicrobiales bacterium]